MGLLGEDGSGIFDTRRLIAPTGYRTPESGQIEINKFDLHGTNGDYEEIRTVTTGKKYFVTNIISNNDGTATDMLHRLATGAAASEVDMLRWNVGARGVIQLQFNVPLVFTSGTRISWIINSAAGQSITLLGFEE